LVELNVLIGKAIILVKWQLIFLIEMLKKARKEIEIQVLNFAYEDFVTVFIKFVETEAPS